MSTPNAPNRQNGQGKKEESNVTSATIFGAGALLGAAAVFIGAKIAESLWGNEDDAAEAHEAAYTSTARSTNSNHSNALGKASDAKCRPQNDEDEDPLSSFLCPITQEPMRDPVVTCYGHCFERAAIERWIRERGTCPMTKRPLALDKIYPCYSMKNAIEEMARRESDWKCELDRARTKIATTRHAQSHPTFNGHAVAASTLEAECVGSAECKNGAFASVGGHPSRYDVRLDARAVEWCFGEDLRRVDCVASYPPHSAYVLLPRLPALGLLPGESTGSQSGRRLGGGFLNAISSSLPISRAVSVVGTFSVTNEGDDAIELVSRDRDASGIIAGVITLPSRAKRIFSFGDTGLWCVEVRSLGGAAEAAARARASGVSAAQSAPVHVVVGDLKTEGGSLSDDALGMC
eukprot:Opistho-2@66783